MLGAKWTENNGDDNDEDEDSYNISKTNNGIQRLCLARTKFWDYKNYSEGEHLVDSEGRILINNVHDLKIELNHSLVLSNCKDWKGILTGLGIWSGSILLCCCIGEFIGAWGPIPCWEGPLGGIPLIGPAPGYIDWPWSKRLQIHQHGSKTAF